MARIRSGDEPSHARSPLRLRLGLALFGLLGGVVGVVVFALLEVVALAVVFGVLGLVAAVDAAVVTRHLRQGPHYQPGPDIPPYRPADPPARPGRPGRRVPVEVRRREYLLLMGTCLMLLLVAWVWLRLVSTVAAVVLTLVAMVIPPIAAVVANTGSRPDRRPPDERR